MQINESQDITLIIGPTAIGKSDYSVKLAHKSGAEIISADAYQVYRHLNIGTAKITEKEQENIPHHLINIRNPNDSYSVVEFINESKKIIENLRSKNTPIIICGGTGLYIHSFLFEYDFPVQKTQISHRQSLEKRLQEEGPETLYNELITIDPDLKKTLHINNTQRVIRNLDIYYQTGEKPSLQKQKTHDARSDTKVIGLTAPREWIYNNINKRVDQMIEKGLVEEVQDLIKTYPKEAQAFQGIGYKETIKYLDGSITKQEMIELIKKNTRNFAKRQLTWFRQINNVQWNEVS